MFDYNRLECKVSTVKPADFDEKWDKWIKEVHDVPNKIEIVNVKEEKEGFGKIIDFYFDSVQNCKVFAKLYLRWEPSRPVVCYYHGHMSFIDNPDNVWHCMNLVAAGYNVCAIDMRYQNGKTIDTTDYRFKEYPSACFNIDDLETCYNKVLDQDALKLVDIMRDPTLFKDINGKPLAEEPLLVAGPSQGGGLSLMVAAMSDAPVVSLSDVPSDCAIKDRIINRQGKYGVIADFIKDHPELEETVMKNQDYFDVINMADRITCAVVSTVGMKDETCPGRYYYQAYKKIKGKKQLDVYEDCGHGGFEEIQLPKKINFSYKFVHHEWVK